MKHAKLTDAEALRLRKYCETNGGQEVVAVSWSCTSSTITRTICQKTAPNPMFRRILRENGIIKP